MAAIGFWSRIVGQRVGVDIIDRETDEVKWDLFGNTSLVSRIPLKQLGRPKCAFTNVKLSLSKVRAIFGKSSMFESADRPGITAIIRAIKYNIREYSQQKSSTFRGYLYSSFPPCNYHLCDIRRK